MPEQASACDVWDLARRGGLVEGELALPQVPRLGGQLADSAGGLRYRLRGLVDQLGRPAARLEVSGKVRARCDRCGAPVEVAIDERVAFYFVADEVELGRLPIEASDEEPLLGSRSFDVAALVEDQAILALPISPRHADCGAAPPADAERRPKPQTHRPFEALASLKKPRC
jgi:uncharacterized protein